MNYIDGAWQDSHGPALNSVNPMDNSLLWQGKSATDTEVHAAVFAAQQAFKSWSSLGFEERLVYVENFAQYLAKNKEKFVELISSETGKPLWESETEAQSVMGKIPLSVAAYHERTGEKEVSATGFKAFRRFKPHGVVAVLGAFNFPAHLSNGHIVPALLAGNTVVYKPSELSPAVASFIMECWHQSGIPKGVISCVQGGGEVGQTLLTANIQAVYFTGSYQTGLRIHKLFADRPDIILALEMGGNNPLLVDEVNDIDAAIYTTLLSTLITAGQRCSCARRVLIKDDAKGSIFLERLIKACQNLRIGSFRDQPEPFMGPVIRPQHALAHLKAQENLIDLGGKPLMKMYLKKENSGLLSPGIVDMSAVALPPDEEIFAPLIQIYRYQSFDEAIALANQTRYGLTAGLLSDNRRHYQRFYQEVRAGLINWNRPTTGALSSLPFGGIGYSGNHRPSAYFAADYCAYPVASLEQTQLTLPAQTLPGIHLG